MVAGHSESRAGLVLLAAAVLLVAGSACRETWTPPAHGTPDDRGDQTPQPAVEPVPAGPERIAITPF